MKSRLAKILGLALVLGTIPMAFAQVPADKPPVKISEYAWPTETSSEPKDDEWPNATALEPLAYEGQWAFYRDDVTCTPRVVREWVKLTCTTDKPERDNPTMFGVLWGMAGELATVKANFVLASSLERFKAPPKSYNEQMTRKMGASATVLFQAKPGSAFVVQLDELFWNENYEGLNVDTREGLLIDVSWAVGEKAPTMLTRK